MAVVVVEVHLAQVEKEANREDLAWTEEMVVEDLIRVEHWRWGRNWSQVAEETEQKTQAVVGQVVVGVAEEGPGCRRDAFPDSYAEALVDDQASVLVMGQVEKLQ